MSNVTTNDDAIIRVLQSVAEAMPNATQIYDSLRAGYFISTRDHRFFQELNNAEEGYKFLFRMTGHSLEHHHAGFYYLEAPEVGQPSQLSGRSRQFAVLAFCLVEVLASVGLDIITMIDHSKMITEHDMETLLDRYPDHMASVDILDMESLDSAFKKMSNYGFVSEKIESANGKGYELTPSMRFYLDVCEKLSQQQREQESMDAEVIIEE
jgi:hypothetical protein